MPETFELRNPGGAVSVSVVFDGTKVSFINSATGAEVLSLAKASGATAAEATLTENAGAIGGTNDGDLPSLASPTAALACEAVREVAAKVNAILAKLRTAGIIAT